MAQLRAYPTLCVTVQPKRILLYPLRAHYPIPVFLIAQLAVQAEIKGQGLGKITLIKALEHLWRVHAHMRAYAVVVDCLNQAAQDFYKKFGFEILCDNNDKTRMFMPMSTVGQLFEEE